MIGSKCHSFARFNSPDSPWGNSAPPLYAQLMKVLMKSRHYMDDEHMRVDDLTAIHLDRITNASETALSDDPQEAQNHLESISQSLAQIINHSELPRTPDIVYKAEWSMTETDLVEDQLEVVMTGYVLEFSSNRWRLAVIYYGLDSSHNKVLCGFWPSGSPANSVGSKLMYW
jgi:hypothetical protein